MSNGQPVLQSGNVTPQHLASWTTDGVIQDSGFSYSNSLSAFRTDVLGINFNLTNADTPVPINLPAGYTKYRIQLFLISGASGTLSTATCSAWTQNGGAGVNIVANSTAITITTNLSDTNNNMQFLTVVNSNTLALSDTVVYFRVQNPQGVPATANITVVYSPMP